MSASLPASVALDQARELISLRHELTIHRVLIRQAQEACGDYLKVPHDDLVGAIQDLRQENALLRAALNLASQDVQWQREIVRRQQEAVIAEDQEVG